MEPGKRYEELTLRRSGVKFCKPVVKQGAAGGVDEEFESKGKGLSLALMLRHSSLKVATMAMKTWLLWVRWSGWVTWP